LAWHLAPFEAAWLMTLILATGSVLLTTVGQAVWQHGGVIFWCLLTLLIEFCHHHRPRRVGTAWQGFACGMMLACRLSSVALMVPLAVWVLLRSPRRALALGFC